MRYGFAGTAPPSSTKSTWRWSAALRSRNCAPEPELRFECPDCEELHDDEEAASSCCGASARCPVCMRDHSGGSIDAVAVAIAGHCRSCRPHYDVDQQLVIEAQFEERTGTFESLNK